LSESHPSNAKNMTDSVRSYTMSRIRSKNTKPELILRSELFKRNLRYRIHRKNLPGNPDIVFSKCKLVIFVNGCFWHMHSQCKDGKIPKSRIEYWKPKLMGNVSRNRVNYEKLVKLGWEVIVIWECEIKFHFDDVLTRILMHINSSCNPKEKLKPAATL
jgi:DNA mismatch endonuclease (patch repair protein)